MEPLNWGKKITNLKIINVPLFDFWTQILIHSPKFTLSSHVSLLSMFRSYWYLFIFPFSFGGSSTTKDSMNAVPISLGNIDEVKTTFTEWLLHTRHCPKRFANVNTLKVHNNPISYVLLMSPFHRWENKEEQRGSDSLKLTKLAGEWSWIWI